nr:unnamed protein product [Callosobruchus analis]
MKISRDKLLDEQVEDWTTLGWKEENESCNTNHQLYWYDTDDDDDDAVTGGMPTRSALVDKSPPSQKKQRWRSINISTAAAAAGR